MILSSPVSVSVIALEKGFQSGYGYVKNGGEILQAGKFERGKLVQDLLTYDYKNKIAKGNCVGDCQNGFGYYKFDNGDSYVGFSPMVKEII